MYVYLCIRNWIHIQPFIELNVAGEEAITFRLVKIPANQIEIKTNVFEENAREQEFLTKSALSDILYTLETKGQQYPAIGRQNGNKNNPDKNPELERFYDQEMSQLYSHYIPCYKEMDKLGGNIIKYTQMYSLSTLSK